jgi:outer membrane receptor protein involved in Fe transport
MSTFWRLSGVLFGMSLVLPRSPLTAQGDAGAAEIRGRVVDSVSGQPVVNAEVALRGTAWRAISDRGGWFTFREVAPGEYILDVRRIGYAPSEGTGVQVADSAVVELTITVRALPVQLSDITVTPGSFTFMQTGPAARLTMSREDIESVPQFGEDIFRAVRRLPGLSGGDYTAQFAIRGGRQDETLIVLDGLEIYEPYHLKDFNEGAISIVDVEAIEGVELLTGGFPAKYGDKRSGVFSMTSRDPRGQPTRVSLGVSFLNARALAQGTFAQDRGSWFFSARRGYFDLVLGLLGINDLPSPSYYDVFSKVRYDLTPRHALTVNLLHARDAYTVDAGATTGFNDSIPTREVAENRYGNSYGWLTLESRLTQRLSVTSLASAGRVTAGRDGTEFAPAGLPDSIYAITNTRNFSVFGLRQDWRFDLSSHMLIEFGFDARRLDADYAIVNRVWRNPDDPTPDTLTFYPQEIRSALTRSGSKFAAFLTDRLQIASPIVLEVGVRYDRVSYTGDRTLSPRVDALVRVAPRSTVRAGWGYYRQTQGISDLAALDGLGRYFPSELSRQWTVGFDHQLEGGGALRIEAYHKRGSALRPLYRNWRGAIDVFPETNEDRILVYPEASRSRGLEVYHTRSVGRKLLLTGSYAWSFVEEDVSRIDNVNNPTVLVFDRTHRAPQDQRHALNLDATLRLGERWSLYSSFAFHTGWPATLEHLESVTNPQGQPDVKVVPDQLYSSSLPSYYRLDARVTRRAGRLRFFAEILNLTNHRNVLGYDYFRGPAPGGGIKLERDPETWFTILPSLGVSWTKTL